MSIDEMTCQKLVQMRSKDRNLEWLKTMLRNAIKLEHSTIPPYLCAYWSIKEHHADGETAKDLIHIAREEMTHMSLVANLLTAVGGQPNFSKITGSGKCRFDPVPSYPAPILDGTVRCTIGDISLQKLSEDSLKLFMQIELPSFADTIEAPKLAREKYVTVGDFYNAIEDFIKEEMKEDSHFSSTNQLEYMIGPDSEDAIFKINNQTDALRAIAHIKEEGEGSESSPVSDPFTGGTLAHFYRFKELHDEARYDESADDFRDLCKAYSGPPLKRPDVYPISIPGDGYKKEDFEGAELAEIRHDEFNKEYFKMLEDFDGAWAKGDQNKLQNSARKMNNLTFLAGDLIRLKRPNREGENFGPTFRVRGETV